ncbi:hypothetical protein MMIN_16160 [Mycolicibacter minnesotensis]|nr:hypothetical protein MMIN_16160 [Mycolicibacter minnesotensis]
MPEGLVDVHAGAVVAEEGFGHEGDGFAVGPGGVFDEVFEEHEVVGGVEQGVEFVVDFGLAAGADFVVAAFDGEAGVGEVGGHDVAEVDVLVVGGDGEVAAFGADFVAEVGGAVGFGGASGVPPA